MNEWPPPSADDAPPAPPAPSSTPVPATPWWQRPIAQALMVAFVFAGVIALVAIGFVRALDSDAETRATTAVTTDPPETTTTLTELVTVPATTSPDATRTTPANDAPGTTAPRVQSAPPVPPATGDGTPTIVVTLPPTTTWQVLAVEPRIGVEINFDGSGGDADDPNSEWVRFVNRGTVAVDMTGWLVRDDGFDHGHVFDPLTLQPDASVTLFSGCGVPTNTERFFCAGEVWDDDGDVVSLVNRSGVLIVQRHG